MKIALIAMSGIRVCDSELLDMGLTLPGFVDRSKIIAALPSLGLLTLAGMTPNDHEISYIEVSNIKELANPKQLLSNFDLVAISSYSAQIFEAYELGDICLELGIQVVIGGPHVSILYKEAKEHATAVAIGEGELVWNKILKDAEKSELKPFYGALTNEFDMNTAPIPSFELLEIDKYNRLTIQTSRGCPHLCEFCGSSTIISNQYKQKPQSKVLREIDIIKDIWKKPFIEFADDNTFVNTSYWESLLTEIKKRRFRWFAETDISIAKHPRLLKLMRESGCSELLIGLESPTLDAMEGIEIRSNWKKNQWSNYKQAIQIIQSYGISVNGCFILGLDKHYPDIFDKLFDFVDDIQLHEVQITYMTPFPGTSLYDRLLNETRLIEPNAWDKMTLFDINFYPANMTVEELKSGFYNLSNKLYGDEFTNIRRKRFKHQLHNYMRDKKV